MLLGLTVLRTWSHLDDGNGLLNFVTLCVAFDKTFAVRERMKARTNAYIQFGAIMPEFGYATSGPEKVVSRRKLPADGNENERKELTQ